MGEVKFGDRWFLFEQSGPYGWQKLTYETGPHYDRIDHFDQNNYNGYATEQEAIDAFEAVAKERYTLYSCFIIKQRVVIG
jgi:hypothetical protein